jgi:hypothetical protein
MSGTVSGAPTVCVRVLLYDGARGITNTKKDELS